VPLRGLVVMLLIFEGFVVMMLRDRLVLLEA
jgi:hypothetical protein